MNVMARGYKGEHAIGAHAVRASLVDLCGGDNALAVYIWQEMTDYGVARVQAAGPFWFEVTPCRHAPINELLKV